MKCTGLQAGRLAGISRCLLSADKDSRRRVTSWSPMIKRAPTSLVISLISRPVAVALTIAGAIPDTRHACIASSASVELPELKQMRSPGIRSGNLEKSGIVDVMDFRLRGVVST